MSRKKTIETVTTTKPAPADAAGVQPATQVIVPRTWLIALTVLFILPWLIAAAIYAWGSREAGAGNTTPPEGASGAGTSNPSGPWGQLEVMPIVISPPLEFVPTNWGPIETPQWRFPQTSREQVEQFLASTGMDSKLVGNLMLTARHEPRINGLIVLPDTSVVRSLPAAVRAQIYLQLAKTPLNDRQANAYRHFGTSPDEWLGRSRISERTLLLIQPLVYRAGDFLYFSDIDVVRSEINDAAELQRLAKALLRESTLLVRLHLNDPSQLDAVAEYWGRGGRRTDVRPLLESIAMSGSYRRIDISHLLPTLAREHLYRYPRIAIKDLDKGALVNCFWTALNFFNNEPDDRLLNATYAFERLKQDYYIVHDHFQLGDIVAFSDSNGNYFHAAVYLADDLVFGKNGTSSLSPWTIVPLERLKGYYVERTDDWNVTYYRRKDL